MNPRTAILHKSYSIAAGPARNRSSLRFIARTGARSREEAVLGEHTLATLRQSCRLCGGYEMREIRDCRSHERPALAPESKIGIKKRTIHGIGARCVVQFKPLAPYPRRGSRESNL
jgi:hypothetical protein